MDKYAKVRQIGEGAFGKAVLVKKKDDATQMVIKEINIIRMSSREREESRKEVAVLAQLKHPNIVAYRESFEEKGNLYIVMDYCAGGDLYSRINSQKGALFSEDEVMDWFVQMCLAIKHIHDRKILHRDIKSQNVFLTSRGLVQLGDFGIAKVLSSTVELARTCIGTPYYLSPEICENKPYNNKSDVWSLGCVLYELTTLKHAFESGNMKNLVLKIIRGSYPPISSKYSYDLRGLVSQLFKRAPRDRPSVNSILKKSFLSQRIHKFLSSEELASEFSHTVMHGQRIARALPPPPKPAARPPSVVRRPEPAGKKYDPSKIYGAPVVRKSRDNKASVDLKKRPGSAGSRPGSAAGSRPGSAAGSRPGSAAGARPSSSNQKPRPKAASPQDLQKKKQEFLVKEKKRREEIQKKELEKRHKDLNEKQKMARINKAREQNWSSLVNSLGSDDSEKDAKKESLRDEPRWQPPARPVQASPHQVNVQAAGRGKYDQYHSYLDKMQNDRNIRDPFKKPAAPPPVQAAPNPYMAAPRAAPSSPHAAPVWRQAPKVPEPTPLYKPYNQRGQNQQGERDRMVNDFIQRRREAALNKNRGQADLFGGRPSVSNDPQKPAPSPYGLEEQQRPTSADSRNREEQEYLEKLRQIRHHNFNERRNLQGRVGGKDAEAEAEARKNKAEALKKQAEDWAKQKKDHLEEKRKDLLDRERRMRELRARAGVQKGPVLPRPAPAAPMTGALNAVGANPKIVPAVPPAAAGPAMTGVLEAIGVTPRLIGEQQSKAPEEESSQKTEIQKQRTEILRKLNQKAAPPEEKEAVRSRWGAGGDNLVFAEKPQEDDPPDSSRSRWGAGDGFNLGDLSLEQTGSQMEATSARDHVIHNPQPESARRQWGGHGQTILNVFQGAPIVPGTLGSIHPDDSSSSPASTGSSIPSSVPPEKPAIGSTITISRSPIQKGTITIKTADEKANKDSHISDEATKPGSVLPSNQNQAPSRVTNQEAPASPEAAGESPIKTDQSEETAASASVAQKPPIPLKKPTVAEKPLLLPKPVLLPKPDQPMQFGKSSPGEAVRSQGAGSLFEKVALEEEDEGIKAEPGKVERKLDTVSVTDLDLEPVKKKTGLVMGITTGNFDMMNSEMLRTCSEPDLTKLFKTLSKDTLGVRVRSMDDMSTLAEEDDLISMEEVYNQMSRVSLEDDDEEEDQGKDGKKEEDNPSEDEEEEEEGEDNDEDDLADLLSVRETMQSLLLDDTDEDSKKSPVKFSLSSDRESRGDTNDGDVEDDSEDKITENEDDQDDLEDQEDQVDQDENDEGNGDDDDNGDNVDGENGAEDGLLTHSKSVDNENPQTPDEMRDVLGEFFNTDDDSDSEFHDGDDEDFDLFGRLEESRAQLEELLGADKLIQVYKTVQALQEDEDENMEEGAKIATELLGKEHEHLYPKIFQLVMADAAFTDDNLS